MKTISVLIVIFLLAISLPTLSQQHIGADGLFHPNGAYGTADMLEVKGFSKSVQSLVERNAIPANMRSLGMNILVRDSSAIYTLVGGLLDANWVKSLSTTVIPDNAVYRDTTVTFTGNSVQLIVPHFMSGTPHIEYVEISDPEGVSEIPAYTDGANIYFDYSVAPISASCTFHIKLTPPASP